MRTRLNKGRPPATGLVAVAAAGALLLSACGGDQPSSANPDGDGSVDAGEPVVGGNLTVAIPSDPQSLDAAVNPTQVAVHLANTLYEKLFDVDEDNQAHPMLVDDYTISDDRLTYTFTLRDDVTFHDGHPLTAEDVVASLERWQEFNRTGQMIAPDIESIEAVDELTVELTLNTPRYPLIDELASPGSEIFRAELIEDVGAEGFEQEGAVGTGPYQLKSWEVGQEIVLERFDEYKSRSEEDLGGLAGAKHAYLDTITFTVVGDQDALINGLLTDQWQHIMPTPDHYEQLKNDPNVVVSTLSGGDLNVIVPNHDESSIFSDKQARHALNLAIDKQAINAATGGSPEIVEEHGAFVSKDNVDFYSTEGSEVYEAYDPEKAKQMFTEAGLEEGDTLRIVTSNTFPQFNQWAVLLQDQLGELGYNVQIDPYDFTTMLDILQEEEWDITTLFFNGFLNSPQQMPPLTLGAMNSSGSPEMDQLLADYNAATSEEEAKAVVDEMQALVWEELPVIVLSSAKPWAAYSPKLKGYDDYWRVFWNSWLEE
ncbi:peptide/nickel transporter substrate-binding protein [Actinobacteria bacterium YIM 96077]|uniref:Peptide/nickel transporter substrate-binding protein n=1 Tax=Phytoactinopolyspora halophila TaxID=1981511 RepID=A0A329QL05_9ACTN|nr:ABC transporter substrate-binding protein [Phytoactinopolyspora halophila]AYY12525.1 peptide/nickel transporter substrate-binding protein [Actinobacteria bacterium YIM 96077]RAW12571.1 peptide/nickel transporter substrate-binding protein [Phytoactinopolyspora halophila]